MEHPDTKQAVILFFVQLALNSLWCIVFFGKNNPLGGMVVIGLLWLAILFTMNRFYYLLKAAGWMLIPYFAWVTYAAILNYAIVKLN